MGCKIRRVPPGWEHPKDVKGNYRPLFNESRAGAFYRPEWTEEPTHYQVYETVTEGTPVSPVFASLDEMQVWLIKQGFSEKAAEKFIETGWAPSMVYVPGKGVSGLGIHSLDFL